MTVAQPPRTPTRYEHIAFDDKGVPFILGTTMKVSELVLDKIAYGWSPEELRFQHPYLTLGQIYAALAYYSDHQEQFDREIEQDVREIDEARQSAQSTYSTTLRRLASDAHGQ